MIAFALIISLLGLLLGLIGVAAAIFFILYGLGFFDNLGGRENNPNAVSKQVLADRLLALNDPAKPYQIHRVEGTDLVAEWKIVDAAWYGLFNKNRLSQAYRASLLLDETRHSVRCYEELGSVNWTAGTEGLTPTVHYQNSFFGGRVLFKKEYAVGYGITDPATLEAGKVYEYKFDVNEIRGPIVAAVREGGWEWVPVTVKRNATY
ncbi:MAG: hypothetical protein PHO26_04330 [Dehalococcoidia bacterium]|nr:hypothetical protein [Dehalococcoidia bacterium]MDD5493896.1 hypothetical protein [Dehalococcoidia bacterium]